MDMTGYSPFVPDPGPCLVTTRFALHKLGEFFLPANGVYPSNQRSIFDSFVKWSQIHCRLKCTFGLLEVLLLFFQDLSLDYNPLP
ncbi:hypothetical protein GJ744_003406 [Endocarpon pusillum]|uniref:Uncharacterized protein n=1 Tax=Endocarpon pusillum TaxID=364733 RepID=A0A8H7AAP0_9EURO|nr:hypothetical protein GJ744_003406 [Endocarpon pusillum]